MDSSSVVVAVTSKLDQTQFESALMGFELPSSGRIAAQANKPHLLFAFWILASAVLLVLWNQLNFGTTQTRHVVPMNAQLILDECTSLYNLPGIIDQRSLQDLFAQLQHPPQDPTQISGNVANQTATTRAHCPH